MEDDFEFERQVGSNRLERVKDSIRDLGDPEEMMIEITGILNETVIIPDVGKLIRLYTMLRHQGLNMINIH